MILDDIVAATKKRVAILNQKERFPFETALKGDSLSFICEVKKASPSKGIIAKDFDPVKIAKSYEKSGAHAISVVTEPDFFLGNTQYLLDIKKEVKIPVLRKDFIIDKSQIYESFQMGADAILLICAILEGVQLQEFLCIADELSLSCLVETHTESEIKMAIQAGARIIGVNNRDLTTFAEDIQHSVRLRNHVPRDIIFVSESGIRSAEDVDFLQKNDISVLLIGEALMKGKSLHQLYSENK